MNESISTTILNESTEHSKTSENWSPEALVKELCYATISYNKNPLGNKSRLNIALREIEKRLEIKHPVSI